MKTLGIVFASVLLMSTSLLAESPETETGSQAWFCAERVMSSETGAVDEGAACLFGQVGFGRFGLSGWALATGTTQPGQVDVTKIRVLELDVAAHWYAYQQRGVAVGPTVWVGGTYGYEKDAAPLEKRAPVTLGAGIRFGGHGTWGIVGYGDHEMVGRGAVLARAHLPLASSGKASAALNGDLATNGVRWELRMRACVGWD